MVDANTTEVVIIIARNLFLPILHLLEKVGTINCMMAIKLPVD